jgi:Uncharacterized protein involved in outer membrane biogenesis
MNKALKWLLGIVVAIVVVIVVAVVALALFFDANAYKPQIVAQVEKSTGRSFSMQAIHLSIFPTLGLKLDKAELGNAKGFGDQPFAQIGAADIGVRILPLLFQHRLEVGKIYLSGLQLNLQKNASGASNWADLAGKPKPPTATANSASSASGGSSLSSFVVGGVDISNASIHYTDAQKKQDYQLNDFSLGTGNISSGKPVSFRSQFQVISQAPAIEAKVQLNGKLTANLATQRYQVQGLDLQIDASGKGVPGKQQQIRLGGDLDYNGKAATARVADLVLQVAGIKLGGAVNVAGIGKDLSFTGPVRIEPFSPRSTLDKLGVAYRAADSSALQQASLSGTLSGTPQRVNFDKMTLKLDHSTATGSLGFDLGGPAIKFALAVDKLDVDHYLPEPKTGSSNTDQPKGGSGNGDDTAIPYQALDAIGVDGSLRVHSLVLHGLKLSDGTLTIAAPRGAAKTLKVAAKGYQGTIDSTTRITPGATPGVAETAKLDGIQINPCSRTSPVPTWSAARARSR